MDDLREKIKNSIPETEIPDSLQSDQIEKSLQKLPSKSSKNSGSKIFRRILTAAAVFALFIAIALQNNTLRQKTATSSTQKEVNQETKQEDGNSLSNTDIKNINQFYYTTDYDTIKKEVKKAWDKKQTKKLITDEIAISKESASEEVALDMATGGEASSWQTTDFSSTNLQMEGVDEGDMIKTDGTYFYILKSDQTIQIVEADTLKMISTISPDQDNIYYKEMYVDKNRLIVVGSQYTSSLKQEREDTYYMDSNSQAVLSTYDLSDIENPSLIDSLYQDGIYRTSRKIGDYIYLFSDYSYYLNDSITDEDIIPSVNGKKIDADRIYIPKEISQCEYLIVSSIDLNQPGETLDQKSLMESGEDFHITQNSIYVIGSEWENQKTMTNFIRFTLKEGKIEPKAVASLPGQLTDTFAINETDSYLRILLTDWNSSTPTNSVYVLDDEMNLQGKIENLAPGETIYSARFIGNTGYFVTYRNIDPLFSVDFSNPKQPTIIGELKITGFSDYLHFYGEDKLFGLGKETDPDTGESLGIKLSMFDISNPKEVVEKDKLILKDIDDCDALSDYKAILVDQEKNLIAFSVENYKNTVFYHNYLVFSYDDEKGFIKKLDFNLTDNTSKLYSEEIRGIYIDSFFYIVGESEIIKFDMTKDFKKIQGVILTN